MIEGHLCKTVCRGRNNHVEDGIVTKIRSKLQACWFLMWTTSHIFNNQNHNLQIFQRYHYPESVDMRL
jgi:hypothetical protein